LQNNESAQTVYQKALFALGTTVKLVRNVPQCSIGLAYATGLFPDLNIEENTTNG